VRLPSAKSNAVVVARHLLRPSVLILVAANLVPLVGVIFWGWDAFVLLMLYWLETAVIAFWTIVRIATLPRDALGKIRYEGSDKTPSPLGLAAFFTLHAGIFMGVHFLFLWELFAGPWARKIHGPRDFVDQVRWHAPPGAATRDAIRPPALREGGRPEYSRWSAPRRRQLCGCDEGAVRARRSAMN
jgi:hypothetical protein